MSMGETQTNQTNRLPPPPLDPTTREHEEEVSAGILAGGSMIEGIAGLVGIVLAIVGLAGLFPVYLLAIATIAVGVALLFEGGAIAVRFSRLISETQSTGRLPRVELGGGMGVEVVGGIAGVVLGILALIGVVPTVLTAVAAIALGGTLMFSSGTATRLNALSIDGSYYPEMTRRIAREMVVGASGIQALTGLAGVILGILAVCGVYPVILSLVAMLCLGTGILLSGAAVSSKMLAILER